ncbi:outer membrane lipoprotein-sorting protein [Sphaerochaeta sp.]|jgi:outer membrane lipoprotein-sorting protein|uniref:outer membrane lipoprotein-sorting protein n=1 Tax=Sphaerochaeta sp. TaxID=1972642 RepID=UPI000B02C704|nr:outer membrane lipoprotein-sorting protein [Sphaerochaeta sp.]MDX9825455.1 outer membrane lipoprotein-sorting protein [Sphaerochaeta sp.]
MKKYFLIAIILIHTSLLWAYSADEIMDKVEEQNRHSSTQARIAATIAEKSGVPSERLIDQYSITENGLSKTVVVFQKPASVKNTRFLMIENEGRDDDRWIFLPALKKIRRIAASEGDSSFIGEITYDDMALVGKERENTFLREDRVNDEDVYVIESIPVDSSKSGYSRVVTYVVKDKWLPVRIEMFDRQNTLLKVMETLEFKEIQGIWSATKIQMANVQKGNVTTLEFQILEYGKPIPPGVFTTKFLETGRP